MKITTEINDLEIEYMTENISKAKNSFLEEKN